MQVVGKQPIDVVDADLIYSVAGTHLDMQGGSDMSNAIYASLLTAAMGFSSGNEIPANDRVALVEVNHYYDEYGKHVFDQLIFYDWNEENGRYDVVAWRLIKHDTMLPTTDYDRGCYNVTWMDGDFPRLVRVEQIRETWTQYDPELLERDALPESKRRELRRFRSDEN